MLLLAASLVWRELLVGCGLLMLASVCVRWLVSNRWLTPLNDSVCDRLSNDTDLPCPPVHPTHKLRNNLTKNLCRRRYRTGGWFTGWRRCRVPKNASADREETECDEDDELKRVVKPQKVPDDNICSRRRLHVIFCWGLPSLWPS